MIRDFKVSLQWALRRYEWSPFSPRRKKPKVFWVVYRNYLTKSIRYKRENKGLKKFSLLVYY